MILELEGDPGGHLPNLGFWETIYDLKQPLKTYLDNSAQALVAWSDATSGASFKEETDF